MPKYSRSKFILFTIFSWIILLWLINYICGLIVQNRYVFVEPINKKTSAESFGYFQPLQDKIILFPGLKPYKVRINKMGFRSVGSYDSWDYKQFEGYYKILCLGDSISFGLFVDDKDSYPYRLQQMLIRDGKKAAVFNAGVGGGTIPDYLYYLKEKGIAIKPNFVAINFCDNDLIEIKKWQKPLYEKMKEENVFSFVKTFKLAKFMRICREGELRYRYKRSTNKITDPKVRNILFSQSKNLDDIFYVVRYENDQALEDPYSKELAPIWKKYFEYLDEIVSLLKREDIDFAVILYPHIYTVFDKGKSNSQEILRNYMDKHNIPYVDLRPVFQKHKESILDLYNNLPRDFHLSGLGNQILAGELYKLLKTRLK